MDGDEPDVVVGRDFQERVALAGRLEGAVGFDGAGVALGFLVVHEGGAVVRWHEYWAAAVAFHVATDEYGGVLRPVAGVLVNLEGPIDLHVVGLHPVNLHVPWGVDRWAERIDVAVLWAVGILALVLVVVVAAVVRGSDVCGLRSESGGVEAAAVWLEGASDLALHAVHCRAAYLDGLDGQQALVGAGVVVGHHDLPLELSVCVEHLRGLVKP